MNNITSSNSEGDMTKAILRLNGIDPRVLDSMDRNQAGVNEQVSVLANVVSTLCGVISGLTNEIKRLQTSNETLQVKTNTEKSITTNVPTTLNPSATEFASQPSQSKPIEKHNDLAEFNAKQTEPVMQPEKIVPASVAVAAPPVVEEIYYQKNKSNPSNEVSSKLESDLMPSESELEKKSRELMSQYREGSGGSDRPSGGQNDYNRDSGRSNGYAGGDRNRYNGDRSFGDRGDYRGGYGDNERRGYGGNFGQDRDRGSYGNRGRSDYGDRGGYGNRDRGDFGNRDRGEFGNRDRGEFGNRDRRNYENREYGGNGFGNNEHRQHRRDFDDNNNTSNRSRSSSRVDDRHPTSDLNKTSNSGDQKSTPVIDYNSFDWTKGIDSLTEDDETNKNGFGAN